MTQPPAGSPSITPRLDFPDWLSPMLVKELRQGMRSRLFIICFLALQAALIFPALIGLLSASIDDSTQGVSVLFWMTVGLPLVLIMPFSGLNAISREKTANTLELIFLTHLTARRIVFGKWVAIVAQILLLVSAVLPYAVLRYYLGGVNITSELAVLAWMVGGSALLTAFTVGISPAVSRVGRALLPVALLIAAQVIAVTSAWDGGPVVRGGGTAGWQFGITLALQTVFLMLLMLEVGAGKIGPDAENHSTPKRLLALASTVTAIIYSRSPNATGWMWIPALVIAGPVLIGGVCEPIREVPSVYRPFLRMGFAGRLLGRLFYPGWPAGVLFSAVVLGIAGFRLDQMATTAMYHPGDKEMIEIRILEAAIVGAFYMPVAFFRSIRFPMRFPTAFYLLFHCVLSVLSLIGVLVTQFRPYHTDHSGPSAFEQVVAWIPTCAILLYARIEDWNFVQEQSVLGGLLVVTLCVVAVILVRMWPAWRTISALEKTAATLLPDPLPPDASQPDPAA